MNLTVENVSVSIDKKTLLRNIGLRVEAGEFVGMIGPNGSGKSTLLKSVYRILQPDAGIITLDGEEIHRMSPRQTAQRMAVVRQESPVEFDFSVREIVMMGRSPHKRLLESDTAQDREIVDDALSRVGMQEFLERSYTTLSGGEKQRVLIARALAQQAKFLVLDEPTNHLDIRYQLQIMDLVKVLNVTVLAALHDLNIAAVYCDRLYVIESGEIVAFGTPEEVLRTDIIRDVFGVETEVIIHPITGKPHITFFSDTRVRKTRGGR
ncbi:heme ABC transporter ATP-binding protein [Effusibacillus lacus]|uniref:ABC transporter n=1 Tax=Effusibacillus lacus TaxID=1348429 RepID=A0A292YMA1_9BACL|nr:heme ABC transporter ATP-binding protein [Effusibacillus lacus]TCS72011.1 iron complex transport system ATP-binding protein [Effusibacillus lacus]GAX90306.1 ABC transporter [Effusibacillus lacus]